MKDVKNFFIHQNELIRKMAAILLFVALFLLTAVLISQQLSLLNNSILSISLFIIVLLIIVSLGIIFFGKEKQLKKQNQRLVKLNKDIENANNRIDAIFRVNQCFIESMEEKEVIDFVLGILLDLVCARNVSFVPIDEHGIPNSIMNKGANVNLELESWLEYLAKPEVRDCCQTCKQYNVSQMSESCPLVENPLSDSCNLLCFPIKRGEKEYGIINLFVDKTSNLDDRTLTFIKALAEEVSSGLESIQFRRRELETYRQVQFLKQKTELSNLLRKMLINAHQIMDAEFTAVKIIKFDKYGTDIFLSIGKLSSNLEAIVDNISKDVIETKKPIKLENIDVVMNSDNGTKAIFALPLLTPEDNVMGVLVLSRSIVSKYGRRKIAVLETIAGQMSLVIQNAQLIVEIEYRATIQERTRLAREIHDSLAQTLGFLKLQTAQTRKLSIDCRASS